ncbi:hypothetical protein [Halalkalibaculum sp. DA384]|uniref:hypothetical protein n=1 Tax=Halalkalibaculum sp. DA384 TaxID=3373606 RepID=UPI003754F648
MKKQVVLLIALLLSLSAIQQIHGQETETLFDGVASHGGFGGPVIKISDVAGTPGVWVGGRGAWLINLKQGGRAISLGGGGFGLATDHKVPDPNYGEPGTDYYTDIGYGGVEVEFYDRSHRLIHYTMSAMVGGGSLSTRMDNDMEYEGEDSFFLFEPGANIEVNITGFFRIAAGLSYRFTNGISRAGFSDGDFSGISATMTFKFGQLRR